MTGWAGAALLLVVALAGCTGAGEASAPPSPPTAPSTPLGAVRDPALREVLLQMAREDQLERTGDPSLPPGTRLPPSQDHYRAVRLQEIVARHGWPTAALVGEDGASAAWLVSQHADTDPAWQQRAVELMRPAVAQGLADATELAYLEDRVAVNRREPQPYGSQVRCTGGVPAPATPLVDPAGVDARRARVGMEPLAAYYRELALMCSQEDAEGATPGS